MANTFKVKTNGAMPASAGTPLTLYTVPSSTTTVVIGLTLCNIHTTAVTDDVQLVLVVGSQNSSNSQRLKEIAIEQGKAAYLIDGVEDIDDAWFDSVETLMITAGASAPENLVQDCVDYIQSHFDAEVESRVIREEQVHFNLPKELKSLL